jgi:hypothetical protein
MSVPKLKAVKVPRYRGVMPPHTAPAMDKSGQYTGQAGQVLNSGAPSVGVFTAGPVRFPPPPLAAVENARKFARK